MTAVLCKKTSSAVAEMGDRLATIDMCRKVEGSCYCAELGSHLTQCGLGEAYLRTKWHILIHPTVWPQYTNVTDRQTDRQTDQQDR